LPGIHGDFDAAEDFTEITAFRKFRNPALCFPAGSGAGPILIAGCGGKLSASFLKNAWRSGYSI
jgi:hypothetical protein